MPPAQWLFHNDRPLIQVEVSLLSGGQDLVRRLVADTGAGTRQSVFQLILDEKDCLQCGGILMGHVRLGGAYSGSFAVYLVDVRIPQLNFAGPIPIVGVPQVPKGFDGIAGFKFLNRFHYGNFGSPDYFGLDLLPVP
jgi:hypothetical protein